MEHFNSMGYAREDFLLQAKNFSSDITDCITFLYPKLEDGFQLWKRPDYRCCCITESTQMHIFGTISSLREQIRDSLKYTKRISVADYEKKMAYFLGCMKSNLKQSNFDSDQESKNYFVFLVMCYCVQVVVYSLESVRFGIQNIKDSAISKIYETILEFNAMGEFKAATWLDIMFWNGKWHF